MKSPASMNEGPRRPGDAGMNAGIAGRLLLAASIISFLATQAACATREDLIKKAFKNFKGGHAIFVSKKNFRLDVYDRQLKVVASYMIGYGSNADMKPKLYEGDNRTPEGVYAVNEILSMDADSKSPSYRVLRDMNKRYFRASEGHSRFGEPDADLGDNAYGPRYFGIDYPNAEDRARYRKSVRKGMVPLVKGKRAGIGYGIAIHGNNDENAIGHLSSNGCVRMFNRDVVELEQYIQLGTPVIILAE
ncbi:MAG TPA: L,D-transpeptidase [Spirochaetota bacterium]|nr:L,D-transpeptidase [Spirochaetota bacterium]HPC41658.1 L,D-transpeptidase [Spirochaetota bacterium]HPL16337.1 L,D-transpeptidase [Spirochaetota bacterium]HQF09317.1 L,D-transpeptidase [Spirochaetota bacterium]HQH98265.1 L,D-transpeptidase [Spirochaetota bacterium]